MKLETILVERKGTIVKITFNQPEKNNSITNQFINEMRMVLDTLSQDNSCSVIILEANGSYFCSGMDFRELTGTTQEETDKIRDFAASYMNILKTLTVIPKIVIGKVTGTVVAGGVGFIAASDIVITDRRAKFSLSEAIWGILPSIVIPFLIRRVGFQKAYSMTLSTLPVTADEALTYGLSDYLSDDVENAIKKYLVRMSRLEPQTIGRIKMYFSNVVHLDQSTLNMAVDTTASLVNEPKVRTNIQNYLLNQKFPWEV